MENDINFSVFKEDTPKSDVINCIKRLLEAYNYSVGEQAKLQRYPVDLFINKKMNAVATKADEMLNCSEMEEDWSDEKVDELLPFLTSLIFSFTNKGMCLLPEKDIILAIAQDDIKIGTEIVDDWQQITNGLEAQAIVDGYSFLTSIYNDLSLLEVWQEIKANNENIDISLSKYIIYLQKYYNSQTS